MRRGTMGDPDRCVRRQRSQIACVHPLLSSKSNQLIKVSLPNLIFAFVSSYSDAMQENTTLLLYGP